MEVSMDSQPHGNVADLHADPGNANESNRTRLGVILIGLAWTLVLLGAIGVLYTGNLVWINNLEHPFIFGCLAAGLLAVGITQLEDESWWHALTGFLSVGAMIGLMVTWGLVGLFWTGLVGAHPVASADAPGDSGYKAVVVKQDAVIDTRWTVYVQQTRGLLSREWRAGCISSDLAGNDSIEYVQWRSPRNLVVYTPHGGISTSVDQRTGKPQSPIPSSARSGC
jgi:hypothetical protein